MATTQAQARPAPSAGSGSRGRGRGKRNSTRLSVNEQERNEENGNGNVKMSEKKRKTGELAWFFVRNCGVLILILVALQQRTMKMWKGFSFLVFLRRNPDRRLKRFPRFLIRPLRSLSRNHRQERVDRARGLWMKRLRKLWRNSLSDRRGRRSLQQNPRHNLRICKVLYGITTSPMQYLQRRNAGKAGQVNRKRKKGMALYPRSRGRLVRPRLRYQWPILR